MDNTESIITNEQLDDVWGNANFGSCYSKREIVDASILKCAFGYATGHTAACICRELKLIKPVKWELTKLGKLYLYQAFVKDRRI